MTPIKQAFYPIYIAIIYKLCTSCQRKTDLYAGKIGSSWIPRIFLVPREEFSFFPRSSRGIKNRGKCKAYSLPGVMVVVGVVKVVTELEVPWLEVVGVSGVGVAGLVVVVAQWGVVEAVVGGFVEVAVVVVVAQWGVVELEIIISSIQSA